jgi:anti-sigma regulatory factor (Ser/Thr protein kinase)
MNSIELKLPSDPKLLKIIRCVIKHLCEDCGYSKEESNAITLAVDEAVANIIKHAYGGQEDQPIILSFRCLKDRLQIKLRDFGRKADPKTIKPRDLEDVKPGGLGVHFIKSTMDIVIYDNSLDKGNQLTLAKYLPGKRRAHGR